ncbi:MAG: MlaD family protein [Gordonia sp. (in: high G+C Gram-positive bacteria)]|uniref:MlaD family protein n=1 Tax=Gordonia sp. (in: high G+C Gram-positive bacteria) TaxID=84139 RepID=UPI003BB6BDF7
MMAFLRKHSILLGCLGLFAVMAVALSFLAFVSLNLRPWQSRYEVLIKFPISGGLQNTSKVALRGVEIGDVQHIQVTPKTVDVTVRLNSKYQINRNAQFAALGLSAAGEQYVDIIPDTNDGPFLKDGDQIDSGQTKVTVPFSTLLESSLDLISQIDTEKMSSALGELSVALNDDQPNQLRSIFNSGGVIFAQLYRVMPQTTALIQNTGTILKTTADIQPDFGRLVNGGAELINGAVAADAELRTLFGTGGTRLTSLTGSLDTITDPITDVMGQFIDIAQQGALRAPTLAVLMPSIRDGSAQGAKMFHDGAWWAMASLYARPYCNYQVTPTRPTQILESSVPVNLYCVTDDPNQQRRGSINAPRPEGDDTANPPPGFDPNSRTVPLKK